MANNDNERNVPTGKALIDLCAAELFARKAEDVVLLELSSVSDVFVITYFDGQHEAA